MQKLGARPRLRAREAGDDLALHEQSAMVDVMIDPGGCDAALSETWKQPERASERTAFFMYFL